MKIAYITPVYPPYGGGMGRVVQATADHLSHQKVTVFTPDYQNRQIKDKKVTALNPQFPLKNIVSKFVEIDNATFLPQIKEELSKFDLVHLHYPFFGTDRIIANWKQEHKDTPLVVTYHMDTQASGLKGVVFKLYRQFYLDKILASADKIIGSTFDYISHSFAQDHFKNYKERWKELPFGVNTEQFKPQAINQNFLDNYQLDRNKKTILFVGGMDPAHEFKGVPLLLESVRKLKKRGEEYQLVLVGAGKLKSNYEQLAEKKGIQDYVNFAGYIEDKLLPNFYSFADVTVLPSTGRNEAFGLVLLESYSCGTPVIASNLPGVRKIAAQAGGVFSVGDAQDLASKIEDVLKDEQAIDTEPRKVAKQYSWNKRAENLEQMYKRLI